MSDRKTRVDDDGGGGVLVGDKVRGVREAPQVVLLEEHAGNSRALSGRSRGDARFGVGVSWL
jgi:hypothetical protein